MKLKSILTISCLIILGLGVFGGIKVLDRSQPNVKVAAGELKIDGYSFTISPSKYVYKHSKVEQFSTTVKNLTNRGAEFDMGDGTRVIIPANSEIDHSYKVTLDGETVRLPITKVPTEDSGLRIEEKLILKIEPAIGGKKS